MANANNFDRDLNAFFSKLDIGLKQYFPNMLAETATEEFKGSFKHKAWDGVPWPAYKNKAREPRRGSLMQRTNALAGSIKPSMVTPHRVVISAGNSRVRYARVHNEGERISGTRRIGQYTNRNFMGRGKAVNIRAHSRTVNYTMPQRRYMGKSKPLLDKIKSRFKTLKNNL